MPTQPSATRPASRKVTAVIKEMLESTPSATQDPAPPLHPDELRDAIAARAYALYQKRGDRVGSDLQDWLDAEREILSREPRA